MKMEMSFANVEANELKIAVDNFGLKVAIFALNSYGMPSVLYFGDVPRSEIPPMLLSLHLHKDEKGNKCVVFCGLVFEYDGTYLPIELKIPAEHLKSLLDSEYIIFNFCGKIDKVEGGNVVCDEGRTFLAPNTFSKDFINELMEEMKDAGNEDEACKSFEKEYKYPPCLNAL